jgi:hypothetical protein
VLPIVCNRHYSHTRDNHHVLVTVSSIVDFPDPPAPVQTPPNLFLALVVERPGLNTKQKNLDCPVECLLVIL